MTTGTDNPLLALWDTPFGAPPFDKVRPEHYRPAFDATMEAQRAAVEQIAADPSEPSFDNTIVALEKSGMPLGRVARVFFGLTGANTSEALQAIERDIAPILSRHSDEIHLNGALFTRIAALWAGRDTLGLNEEEHRLLDRYHTIFERAGAGLDEAGKRRLAEINERLATLGTEFSQNVLADEASWKLVLDGEADLAGLPDWARAAAAQAAEDRDLPGKYVVTLARSSVETFLQFSTRRDLREKVFAAWIRRGESGGDTDNRALIAEMIRLRHERARLLGHESYAHFNLADAMAKTPEAVTDLLHTVWAPGTRLAAKETAELQALVAEEGGNFKLTAADWRHYADRLRKRRYDFDEGEVKPFFALDNMIEAAFWTARQLFGVTFAPVADVPVYHPDVRVWRAERPRRTVPRPVHRRLFRARVEAERRLDGRLPQPAPPRRRRPADHRQRHELLQAAEGQAGAAFPRRRAHALPRVRPRAARPPVERHLSASVGNQRRHGFRRAAIAALRALAAGARGAEALRRPP